ncbi:MAG: hypothetical protein IPJ13_29175 [Saprospiraceae bacterium]|nr:hypothetical protein [Saprospiraceae bacterium]
MNDAEVILDCEETLYSAFYNKTINCDEIKELHLVTETSSILGVEYYKYLKQDSFKNDKLNTQIEWKIKPGYEREFCRTVRSLDNGEFCNMENFFFTNGKMDYIFEENKKEFIESNLLVFSKLRENSVDYLTKYVKSVKQKHYLIIKNGLMNFKTFHLCLP